MLKMMVRPRQAPCSLLGVGTYYVGAAHNTTLDGHRWQMLELKNPLILDGQHARNLYRKHGTNSLSRKKAAAGAWALRDEVVAQGHDAVIVVEGVGDERHLTIAHFDTASVVHDKGDVIAFPARNRSRAAAESKNEAVLAAAS